MISVLSIHKNNHVTKSECFNITCAHGYSFNSATSSLASVIVYLFTQWTYHLGQKECEKSMTTIMLLVKISAMLTPVFN